VLETKVVMVGPDETITEDGLARPLTRETRETGRGKAADDHVDHWDLPLSRHHEEVEEEEALASCEGRREGSVRVCEARIMRHTLYNVKYVSIA
jgi:hypothetical protein